MIFFVAHNLFFNKVQDIKIIFFFILFFLFLFVEPFGSDTGLIKAGPLFILFPFIYEFSKLPVKKTYLIILVTLLPFAILEKPNSIYEDSNLAKLHYSTKIKTIQGISTNEKRAQFVNSIDDEYKTLTRMNYAVFFYGNKSHIFRYLYPSHDFNIKDFYQPLDDLLYLNLILNETNKFKKSAIFIVNDYPSENFDYYESVLEKELLKNHFKLVFKNKIIYYKN